MGLYRTSAQVKSEIGQTLLEYAIGGAADSGLVGLQVLPILEVGRNTGTYGVITAESLLTIPENQRHDDGGYARISAAMEQANYTCKEYGLETPLDDATRRKFATLFDYESVEAKRLFWLHLLAQEKRIADLVFNTSNLSSTDVTNTWDDASNATPKADIDTARDAIRSATGMLPDTVLMNWKVFQNVLATSEIKDYLQYTNPLLIAEQEQQKRVLAAYFGVDRVLVANRVRNTADEGQTGSYSDVWDDEYVLVAKTYAGNSKLDGPGLGRTILWTEDSPDNAVVETYRDDAKRSDILRVRHSVVEKLVLSSAGYLLSNITS